MVYRKDNIDQENQNHKKKNRITENKNRLFEVETQDRYYKQ